MYTRYDGPGYAASRNLLRKVLGRWEPVKDPGPVIRNWRPILLVLWICTLVILGFGANQGGMREALLLMGVFSTPMGLFFGIDDLVPRYRKAIEGVEVQYSVKLTFACGGKVLGKDSGVLWFEADTLRYQGHRGSFSFDKSAITIDEKLLTIPGPEGEIKVELSGPTPHGPEEHRLWQFPATLQHWQRGEFARVLEAI